MANCHKLNAGEEPDIGDCAGNALCPNGGATAFSRWAADILEQASRLAQQTFEPAGALSSFCPSDPQPCNGGLPIWLRAEGALAPVVPAASVPAWSVEELRTACTLKGILYDETCTPTAPRLLLARHDDLTLIRTRADLPPEEHVAVLAHALGHIYFAHSARVCAADICAIANAHGDIAERAASVWAAHCLVNPAVYEEVAACDHWHPEVVNDLTALRLGIPPDLVRLWQRYRGVTFAEPPWVWLGHP